MDGFRNALRRGGILVLDGPMGTELQRRGVPTPVPLWSAAALQTNPNVVRAIHADYVAAGADILTTNTFRTSARTLQKVGRARHAKKLTRKAVALAEKARERQGKGRPVWIAGSLAPLEECYSPNLAPFEEFAFNDHLDQAGNLADSGVDLILLETMNTVAEARAALKAAQTTGLPVGVSVVCDNRGRLLSGERAADAARELSRLKPDFLSVNCTPLTGTTVALRRMAAETGLPLCAYANAGQLADESGAWRFDSRMNPAVYVAEARKWVKAGARIIGSCCGTGPDYTRALAAAFK